MSQAKVDSYKEYKQNRKKIAKREKRIRVLNKILTWVAVILVLVGIGFLFYLGYKDKKDKYLASLPDYKTEDAMLEDMLNIRTDYAADMEGKIPDSWEW